MSEIINLIDGTHKAEPLESAILGAMMLEPMKIPTVVTILKPEMFYNDFNRDVYEAIISLFEKGRQVDLMVVTTEMFKFKQEKYKFNNLGYEIALMIRDVVSSVNIVTWCLNSYSLTSFSLIAFFFKYKSDL